MPADAGFVSNFYSEESEMRKIILLVFIPALTGVLATAAGVTFPDPMFFALNTPICILCGVLAFN